MAEAPGRGKTDGVVFLPDVYRHSVQSQFRTEIKEKEVVLSELSGQNLNLNKSAVK